MIETLEARNLSVLAGIRHGFFTRRGGVSEGPFASLNADPFKKDDPGKVAQNRALIAETLGAKPENLLTCRQVHGTETIAVSAPWAVEQSPGADALVTKTPGLALGVLTADCVPVLLADPKAGVIGAVHAGWQGALAGILESAVAAMESLGAKRGAIQAAIGPCIWQDSYEVDLEFMDRFLDENELNNRFFFDSDKPDHFLFELPGYVRDKLRKMELAEVTVSPADTCADEERFFSYRRCVLKGEPDGGRQISTIMLG